MKSRLLFLALVVLAVSVSVDAAEIAAASDIVSVVVYPDRAMVTRSADLQLVEKGEHLVRFSDLPSNIDINSLQVKGEGQAGVHLLSTETRKIVLEHPRAQQIAKLEREIQDLRDQIAAVEAHLKDLKTEDDLVHSIGVYTGEQFSKEFITCEPKPEEWAAMVEFQRINLARISEDILQMQIHKRELNRELDAMLRRLAELQGQAARESLTVSAYISVFRPGSFRLLLSYVIYGANWYPSYDAHADVQQEIVRFSGVGNVRQNTGEDWKNISLALSTARPAIGASMPELNPWYLRPRPQIFEAEGLEQKMAEPLRRDMAAIGAPAEMVVADIVEMETSVQFEVPYRLDVPSDNSYHRATLFAEDLPTQFSYTATPKLALFAYLAGKTQNTTGAHWLPGKTTVFVNGNMIGTVYLEPVAPNEEITLSFGTDEAVKVEREELARKEDESRIFGRRKEQKFKDKITLTNNKAKAIKLTLIDQIPVSQHDDIKVTDVRFSQKPTEVNSDTGIVKWDLGLEPGMKKEITIEFTVTHPIDMNIFGM